MAHIVFLCYTRRRPCKHVCMYMLTNIRQEQKLCRFDFLLCFSMLYVSFPGAGDGMVKFWDMRKTDKPSWQLSAPSPGAAQPVLTPTPQIRSKVAHAPPTFSSASQARNVYSMHMHGSLLAEQL